MKMLAALTVGCASAQARPMEPSSRGMGSGRQMASLHAHTEVASTQGGGGVRKEERIGRQQHVFFGNHLVAAFSFRQSE